MKAWRLHQPAPVSTAPLVLEDVERPSPQPGEVLVEVRACGLCRTDLHVVEGDLPQRRSPVTPGHQIVGRVHSTGTGVDRFRVGDRVGVAWLQRVCGECAYCRRGKENLCDQASFTGWSLDGGFAEYALASTDFLYHLPDDVSDFEAAPLLCAGIIGYRSLAQTGLDASRRCGRLGIYGFGAAGHVVIQLARARGIDVYVATRDRDRHQALARELGAAWVGDAAEPPPVPLDAAILFAPAGELVPPALKALDKGGTLVLGGIHMSRIPELDYDLLYGERVVRTVANNTRADGQDFLLEAARIPIRTHVEVFPFRGLNTALAALKNDAIRGAAVLALDA